MSPLPASPALNSLLRLLREGAPLVERVGALRRLLLEHPGTRQAWYLAWQPQAQTYTPVPPSPALPPGAGEPNRASDLALRERLVRDGRLALDELRRSASWLGARLRRAGVEHGMAFALDLQAGDEGLLLVASDTPQSAALDWLGLLLAPLLAAARGVTRAAPFLAADPQPALLLDGEAQAVDGIQPGLPCLAWRAAARGLARLPPGQPWATGARQPGAGAGPRRGGGGVRRTHPALAVHSRQRRGPGAGALPRRNRQPARRARGGAGQPAVPADHREHHRPDFPAYPRRHFPRRLAGFLDPARLLAGGTARASGAGVVPPPGPRPGGAARAKRWSRTAT